MKLNMITAHHNYDEGYVSLGNLLLPGLPESIEVEGDTLVRKGEFHISLVCVKRLAPLIKPDDEEAARVELVEHFQRISTDLPLNKYKLLREFRVVERDDRKTLVVMAQVPGIERLFDRLRKIYPSVDIPTQQPHITLYTLPEGRGIGLISKEEVEKLSHIVQVPELKNLV